MDCEFFSVSLRTCRSDDTDEPGALAACAASPVEGRDVEEEGLMILFRDSVIRSMRYVGFTRYR